MTFLAQPAASSHSDASGAPRPKLNDQPALVKQMSASVLRDAWTDWDITGTPFESRQTGRRGITDGGRRVQRKSLLTASARLSATFVRTTTLFGWRFFGGGELAGCPAPWVMLRRP